MSSQKKVTFLTGNIVETETGFIAYFEEIPEMVVQGDTESETKNRLIRGLKSLLEDRKEEAKSCLPTLSNKHRIVKQFELSAAL